jgi:hypothetical protein
MNRHCKDLSSNEPHYNGDEQYITQVMCKTLQHGGGAISTAEVGPRENLFFGSVMEDIR